MGFFKTLTNNNNNNRTTLSVGLILSCYIILCCDCFSSTWTSTPCWSRIASFDVVPTDEFVSSSDVVPLLITQPPPHKVVTDNGSFQLGNPREWMEYMATCQESFGAYTVLRCEQLNSGGEWHVEGLEFHLNRLSCSYSSAFSSSHEACITKSRQVTDTLLSEANKITTTSTSPLVVMLTLLWTPSSSTALQHTNNSTTPNDNHTTSNIHIHGHAKHIPIPQKRSMSAPIVATLALSNQHVSLPRRYHRMPEAKLSSWCSERRSLEQQFKYDGIGEVILTRPSSSNKKEDDWELLEGLTSNLFIVYHDGTIRTSSNGILQGYARHLVLQILLQKNHNDDMLDYQLQEDAPLISEVHLWKEVFISSSIQLICPIHRILIPASSSTTTSDPKENLVQQPNFEILWEQNSTLTDRLVDKLFMELQKRNKVEHNR